MTVSPHPSLDRLQSLSKRKHRYTESSSSTQDDTAHGSSKRRKLRHPTVPPPAFWDDLSTVPLCASALRELNRRKKCQALARKDCSVSPESTRRSHATANNDCLLADQFLQRCSANSLKGVKRLAKHGGPDLTELRGCHAPRTAEQEMSSSQSSLGRRKRGSQSPEKRDSSNTTTTRSTGPYDRAFQQHLIDHRIFPNRYKYHDGQAPPRPENLDEIRDVLSRSRQSLSPSQFPEERFENFQQADEQATKETDVMSDVIPIIEGHVKDKKCVATDVLFANLDPLTNGELVPGKPDRCHGARPEQLDRNIRRELGGHIIPSTQHDLPIVPTFFLEAKGPDGSLSVATRQACYVGALGARGIRTLQSYGDPEPVYDNKAYTLTSIYHGGQLKMYASHPIRPSSPGGAPGYVMTQIDTWSLTGNSEAFRKGTAAYRNGIDWSKQKRDEAIESANKMARGVDDLGLSFASEASAENTDPSQDTITHHESNRTPSICDSDTSADPADLTPIGKRHKAIELAVEDAAAQLDPREEAASRGSFLKHLVRNLDTGDDEQSESGRISWR